MLKVLIILTYFCYSTDLFSQTVITPVAAIYSGFGAYSIRHIDGFSFTSNSAALAQVKQGQAGAYAERRFLLKELNNYTGIIAVRGSSGNFGLKACYAGFSDYNETQLGIAYARSLGNKLDLGLQVNYNGIRINNYGNANALGFEIGSIWHVTDKLHTGIHVANPVGGKFGKRGEENLPAVYAAGIGFDASDKFMVSVEIQKQENQVVNVNAGFQYRFISLLLLRAGIATATSTGWFGLGLNLKSLRIDITTSYHPQLGISPGLLLLFQFKGKQN